MSAIVYQNMIITVVAFKGGVGKSTTAIHLACYLNKCDSTLMIDGDLNRSAVGWSKRGTLPFTVVDEKDAAGKLKQFEHIVIDTPARPGPEDLALLADRSDLLVIPTTPDALGLEALKQTIKALAKVNYKVLLTIIPPYPSTEGEEAREQLKVAGLPIFRTGIRAFGAYRKAALAGVPVYEVKNDRNAKRAWRDYLQVGQELLL